MLYMLHLAEYFLNTKNSDYPSPPTILPTIIHPKHFLVYFFLFNRISTQLCGPKVWDYVGDM